MPKVSSVKVCLLAIFLIAFSPLDAAAADFYVRPNGLSPAQGGLGSEAQPWNLAAALAQPASVHPGDTIWIHGGTFFGLFTSTLAGTNGQPIYVRAYPGERPILDGGSNSSACVLTINGSNSWYWGLEVMSSSGDRTAAVSGSSPADLSLPCGINVFGANSKVINTVVHDTAGGISPWTPAVNAEIHGNIIFNNGWHGPDRGHGHAIYTQNDSGLKKISDNIMFNQFSYGVHAYTEGGRINNFELEGNISFNNGAPEGHFTTDFLLGGLQLAQNSVHRSNFSYFPAGSGTALNLGYSAGCTNALLDSNYLVGATALRVVNCSGLSMSQNTFIGSLSGVQAGSFPGNTFLAAPPAETKIFFRRNKFDSSRAHLVIFNWTGSPAISADLSAMFAAGERYSIVDVQNLFGQPVAAGIYNGSAVSVPATNSATAPPIGAVPTVPLHTGPEFNVFLVHKLPPAAAPTPPAELKIIH